MKSTVKLIKRFVFTLIAALVLLLVLNMILIITVIQSDTGSGVGYRAAQELAGCLLKGADGQFELNEEGQKLLASNGSWAILIQDGTGDVIWHSQNLPEEIPSHYSVAEISWYTRGYIADYPTTTASKGDDLVIVGNRKDSYWKHLYPAFSLDMIRHTPRNLLLFIGVNVVIIIIIYMVGVSGVLRSVKPIVRGIELLPEGQEVYVKEKGILSELAAAINQVSGKLRSQEYELQKKEQARVNWISGVSHDIRTPLSMVMGYAAEIEEETEIPADVRQKAGIIRLQSIRMKNLIEDLNLASKLEYNMQPMKLERINMAGLLRETAVDFMNLDIQGRYPVELFCGGEDTRSYGILGDKELLKRAFENLLVNAQVHNAEGCHIRIELKREAQWVHIVMEDDGVGVTEEQLERLKNTPHYMLNDKNAGSQRHGLGLLIVQQIVTAHGGEAEFGHSQKQGFRVEIRLACD